MIWIVVAVAVIWLAIGAILAFVTTAPPRWPAFVNALSHSMRFIALIALYLALFVGAGFAILIFSTNPPPPRPQTANMVDFWRYCAFGVTAFFIGAACHRSIQRFGRNIEK